MRAELLYDLKCVLDPLLCTVVLAPHHSWDLVNMHLVVHLVNIFLGLSTQPTNQAMGWTSDTAVHPLLGQQAAGLQGM